MALKFLNNGYFAGKVGIGTESPSVALQLGNSTLGQTKLAIFNSEGGGEVGLTIKSRTNRAKLRVADNDSNAYVVAEAGKSFFGTSANGDANNITVLTGGNVGIGTTSPGAKLEIKDGNLWLNGATSNYNPEIFFIDDAGPTGIAGAKIRYENNNGNLYFDHKWDTATSGFFFRNRVDGTALNTMSLVNGKVGIDIDTPQAPLSFANVAGNKIDFYYNTTTNDRYGIQVQASELRIHSGAAGDSTGGITFGKDNGTTFTERMRITNAGNVGIGISNPASYGKFVVQGTGNLINANASSGAATFQLYEGGQGRFAITTLNGSAGAKFELAGSETMRITSAGAISFGSTGTAYGTSGQVLTSAGNASPTWTTPTTGTVTGTGAANRVTWWDSATNITSDAGFTYNGAGRVNTDESFGVSKNGADTVADGPFFRLTNAAQDRQYIWQLDASNNIDYWYYNGSTWTQTISLLNNGGAIFTGNVNISSAALGYQENTDVDTGTETVAEVSTAAFTAAFFDFVIKKTTNVRSGTVYACHDGTNVEFTETSTQDLGDTSDVTLSVDISGGSMRLRATTTSDDWSIKSLIRAI